MSIPRNGKILENSVKLSDEELKALVELRKQSNSDTAFARNVGVDRTSLIRIITLGSGNERNVKKIRRKLSKINQAA